MHPNYLADLQRQLNEIRRLQLQHDVDIKRLWGLQSAQGPGWPVGGDVPPLPLGGPWIPVTSSSSTTSSSSSSSSSTEADICPECWTFTMAGVADAWNDTCEAFNATHVLQVDTSLPPEDQTYWNNVGSTIRLGLLDPFSGSWVLMLQPGSSMATYRTTGRYCDGSPIELTLENPGFGCDDWPPTVTVTPTACPAATTTGSTTTGSTTTGSTTTGSTTSGSTTTGSTTTGSTTTGSTTTASTPTLPDCTYGYQCQAGFVECYAQNQPCNADPAALAACEGAPAWGDPCEDGCCAGFANCYPNVFSEADCDNQIGGVWNPGEICVGEGIGSGCEPP